MKKLLSLLTVFVLSAFQTIHAEEGWETNLDTGLKKAAEENKQVMVEFTGSDWCPPCMKMHEVVFSQPDFVTEASKKYVLVKLDFPNKKEIPAEERAHNEAMAQKHKVEGFPTVLLLKSDGTEIKRNVGYNDDSLEKFLAWLNEKAS